MRSPTKSRPVLARLLWTSAVVIFVTAWSTTGSATEQQAEHVIARARASTLWTKSPWLALVHYRRGLFGGLTSQVDGAAFFLAPGGKSDPRAELEATLRAFYSPATTAPDDHARCRFPARLHWLDEELHFTSELPPMRCPKLERYEAAMRPESVALAYAASRVDSPVSAFGHTFLLFRRSSRVPATEVAVEYAADTDASNPLVYAFKGLSGMFRGRYSYYPAQEKITSYLAEDRDVWEYELALTPSESSQLTRHLWELSATHFDYYYMSENCSFGIIVALDGAVPRLRLLDKTKFILVPIDTVRAVFGTRGLVRSARYSPARNKSDKSLRQLDPHRGHGSMRVLFGPGFTTQYDDGFATLGYRVALHDLADPAVGQPALSQVQFLDGRVRYEAKRRRFTLNEVTFAELLTLHPLMLGFKPSWRARAYGLRFHDRGCDNDDCFAHGLDASLGLSLATSDERLALFVMADAYFLFSDGFDGIDGSSFRGGLGPYGGVRVNFPDEVVAMFSGTWSYLPGEHVKSTYELRGSLRLSLATDVAIGAEALVQPRAIETQFLSYLYF